MRFSTLDRYLLREWSRVFLITLLGFPILVIVIDLTDKLDTYLGRGIKPAVVAWSYVFDLPEKMFLILPVAVLFATVFTVGALGRHSELTAAKASGISFHRLVLPLFAAAGAAFVAGLVLAEIAPVTTSRRLEMLGEKAIRSTTSRYNFVYRADRGWVYAIRALELKTRELTRGLPRGARAGRCTGGRCAISPAISPGARPHSSSIRCVRARCASVRWICSRSRRGPTRCATGSCGATSTH